MNPSDESFRPWKLAWSTEASRRFWAYWADRAPAQDWFSFRYGRALLDLCESFAQVRGTLCLDYGAGRGFLVRALLERGAEVVAADGSEEALGLVAAEHQERPGWRGPARIQEEAVAWGGPSFDWVFCVEVIEHVDPARHQVLINELIRLVRPGGRLVVTTPLDEDLSRSMVFCPSCGAEFHKVQHVTTLSAAALASLIRRGGLELELCCGVDLDRFALPTDWKRLGECTLLEVGGLATKGALRWADRRLRLGGRLPRLYGLARPGPTLMAVATVG